MTRTHENKTNAMRLLDQRGISYVAHRYNDSITTAAGVAGALGVPVDQVFKTLVLQGPRGEHLLLMLPGDKEADTGRLAREISMKDIAMVSKSEAERLTGLQTGGIGALALLHRAFHVLIDRAACEHDAIFVNAGRRGVNVQVQVADLIKVTGAQVVTVAARHL